MRCKRCGHNSGYLQASHIEGVDAHYVCMRCAYPEPVMLIVEELEFGDISDISPE